MHVPLLIPENSLQDWASRADDQQRRACQGKELKRPEHVDEGEQACLCVHHARKDLIGAERRTVDRKSVAMKHGLPESVLLP